MPAIEIDRLAVSLGSNPVIRDLSFEVAEGEVVALLGPNGAGKTTTLETLEGYHAPKHGSIRILGLDPSNQHPALVERVGIMLQGGGLYPMMSPRRALRLYASYYRSFVDPEELLDLVDLRSVANRAAKRLSGGERQRLALALALVGRPEVLLLDEPTAGVDPAGRLLIREVVRRVCAEGTSVLYSTHELAEAEEVANRIAIIDHGRLVAEGSLAELTRGTDSIRFESSPGVDLRGLEELLGTTLHELEPGHYLARIAGSPSTIKTVATWLEGRGLPLDGLAAGRSRLEEVYLSLIGNASTDESSSREQAKRQ